jgi:NADH:ubiquinone oxidoreductase subunit 5 (subunit L)/multisubunit Na+/H+ antiporter MnhA subunit
MSGVLVAIPALSLLAAAVVRLAALTPRTAARVVVSASALAVVGAIALLISVVVDGPVDAVITDSDGAAVVGLTADRVGAILLVLTSLVGLIVQSFASRSLLGDPRATRFHVLAAVLASATSLVGVAATGSGVLVAWVATSVTLVALLGHKAPWPAAVRSQRLTARSFLVGDTALFIGMIVGIVAIGDLDLRVIGAEAGALDAESIGSLSLLTVVAVCLVIAGIARSALVPLHAWLPSTLAAPTPVSALLHAGVINGAGVLLIRFSPVFASSASAMALAFAIGIVTALFATAIMLVRTDVKGGLVWSTSGQMGFMVVQLGVGAFAAALFHIVGHALYKAAMFLGAGGAISAHSRQQQRPHLGSADAAVLSATATRVVVGLLAPLSAFALALWLVDPHLTAAATILIVVFGALSVGRAANGWMSATPFAATRTIATAIAGVVVATFAYVGGIALFEGFVVDAVPYEVPAAVGPVWVAGVLAAIGTGVVVVAFTPGPRGDALRRRIYTWLLSTSTPVPAIRPTSPAPPAPPAATAPLTAAASSASAATTSAASATTRTAELATAGEHA